MVTLNQFHVVLNPENHSSFSFFKKPFSFLFFPKFLSLPSRSPMSTTNLSIFNSVSIKASSSSSSEKFSEQNRRKSTAKWWSPIFGWSSEPDYVEPVKNTDLGLETGKIKARFTPGCFTEEKAKLLRMKMKESYEFHDIMYHSAIASRLASDLMDRDEKL